MHDSFTPLGGLVPMWMMQLGEVVYGGVGSGLYGMLLFAIIAVFVAGLMVGRTPEYLGKKIEAYEMKMASIGILVPCAVVLIGTAVARRPPAGQGDDLQPRGPWLQRSAVRLLLGRQQQRQRLRRTGGEQPLLQHRAGAGDVLRPVLDRDPDAGPGRVAGRRRSWCRPGSGTLPTHTPLFVVFLVVYGAPGRRADVLPGAGLRARLSNT